MWAGRGRSGMPMRSPAAVRKPRPAQLKTFLAPRNGWIANLNLAQPNAQNPDGTAVSGASVLDNWFPTAVGVTLMRGSQLYATLGDGDRPVTALFSYVAGAQEQLFGATDNAVYDITVIANAANQVIGTDDDDEIVTEDGDFIGWASTKGLETLVGQSGGDWVVQQFATAGGIFLRGVNGEDPPFVYDGTTWGAGPALTFAAGETTTADQMAYVWAYKQRLFFTQKDSLDAWYLPVDQVGGELVKLPLGGVFGMGGSLLFGAVWSNDAGEQGGLSEQIIFVTTEGEVAVYQGSNPSDATDWGKVGVYRIGRPLGKQAHMRAGGDVVIATNVGFVPVSQATSKDFAALAPAAVSYPIEVAWNDAVERRSGAAWNCAVWANKQMAVVALPTVNEQPPAMFIANVRTGAWCRRTNWDGTCLAVFKDRLFFGSQMGSVVEANVSGLDQGNTYTGVCVPLFDDFGSPASLKVSGLARAVMLAPAAVGEQLSMQADFVVSLPPNPDARPVPVGNQWGNAIWGSAVWGGTVAIIPQQNWRTPMGRGTGYALSPAVQVTSGSVVPIDATLVRVEVTFTTADIVS